MTKMGLFCFLPIMNSPNYMCGDISQFLSYVVAALRNAYPDCCPGIDELLRSLVMPEVKDIAASCCNEIEALEGQVVLVLDDFHKVSPSGIDEFLNIVLKHPPRNLHLVIATRRNPSLSLSAMRARGTVIEVRMQQLAFDENETRMFIRENLGVEISDEEIAVVQERTEGWPAAVRLTGLALSKTSSPAKIVTQLPKGSRAIRQYLMQEVLANQRAPVREHLLRVAFLDRFTGSFERTMAAASIAVRPGRDWSVVGSPIRVAPHDGQSSGVPAYDAEHHGQMEASGAPSAVDGSTMPRMLPRGPGPGIPHRSGVGVPGRPSRSAPADHSHSIVAGGLELMS